MREQGMTSAYARGRSEPHRTRADEAGLANLLDREFDGYAPHTHLASDLTYVRVGGDWAYVCLLVDLANRGIVGHSAGRTRDAGLMLSAFATLDFPLTDVQVFHTGVVTFCWTPVSLFFDYAMSPSSRLRLAMLVPKVSLILSSRYQVMYASSRSMNPLMVTPAKSRPWKNSCLRRPKNPSAAALSGEQPFALIERVRPCAPQMRIHSGHR